jgi:hypothetical protein
MKGPVTEDQLIVATQATQYGADQELEATLGLMETLNIRGVDYIRNVRRPKPPSLKEQALHDLEALEKDLKRNGMGFGAATIRRALEQL